MATGQTEVLRLHSDVPKGSKTLGVRGSFNTVLKKPVYLKNGDALNIHKAVLDVRAFNKDNVAHPLFEPEEDVEVELEFLTYIMGGDGKGLVFDRDPNKPIGNSPHTFFLCKIVGGSGADRNNCNPVLHSFKTTIKAGSRFTRKGLAEHLTREFQRTYPKDARWREYGEKSDDYYSFYRAKSAEHYGIPTEFLRHTVDYNWEAPNTTNQDRGYVLVSETATSVCFPEWPWDPLTDAYPLVGSTQVSLEWNEDLRVFRWVQLHSPIYDQSGNEIGHSKEIDNGRLTFLSRNGGVALVSMKPDKVWKDFMNFPATENLTHWKMRTDVVPHYPEFTQVYTTDGFVGLDVGVTKKGFDSNKAAKMDNDYKATLVDTTTQNSLPPRIAGSNYLPSHFILRIHGMADQSTVTTYDNKEVFLNCMGVISAYYQHGHFLTTESDESLVIEHIGKNAWVSNLEIEILNGDTGEPVPNLGPLNTIYIKVKRHITATKKKVDLTPFES